MFGPFHVFAKHGLTTSHLLHTIGRPSLDCLQRTSYERDRSNQLFAAVQSIPTSNFKVWRLHEWLQDVLLLTAFAFTSRCALQLPGGGGGGEKRKEYYIILSCIQ